MSARTLRRALDVRRRHVAFIPCMHAYSFLWFLNLYLVNLLCRDLVFADLVLANLSGPNLLYLLELLLWCCYVLDFYLHIVFPPCL